jgi:3-hydroxybutyryl-CoA dehydrogenase
MMIQTICICGAGTMGSGIAQVAASTGFNTVLFDINETVLKSAEINMEINLQKMVDKNRMTADEKTAALSRIRYTNDLHECIADVIIEAIIEKPEIKISLFNQLAEINHGETIFASNTSSLSITELADKINNPQRVIGLHFFNPAPLMKLVEVVNTTYTDKQTTASILQICKTFNKTAVVCKDSPGFIVNRVARPFYIESLRIAEEGGTSFEHIDQLLEASGFKMGPFKLMDLIGNDVNYAVSVSVHEQLGKPERLNPSYLQKQKVDNKELGKKSGKGYYTYTAKN